MQDQPNERIAGLEARRTTLKIIIWLGREAQHGPLGEIEVIVPQDAAVFELIASWAKAPTPTASAEVTIAASKLRRCPECGGPLEGWAGEQHSQQCSQVDELQRRADEIASAAEGTNVPERTDDKEETDG